MNDDKKNNTDDVKDVIKKEPSKTRYSDTIVWVLIGVAALAVISFISALYYYDCHVTQGIEGLSGVKREEWGQFGDYVGG
ncbi:MAG TPA: hypothetical protein VLB82_07065 [Thermodesulfobacteriota bacterium]|nr:hypothetical protein [Thermodesulfobacteriota bacterium]